MMATVSCHVALERQNLSCMYLAHHELESVLITFVTIIFILISIIIIIVIILS